jgi:hypothetical protein
MDPDNLQTDWQYIVIKAVKVCLYDDKVTHECEFTDKVDLPIGTALTYVGADEDPGGGFVFEAGGNKYCLHDNDLSAIEEG